jgi:hypothetical protein
MSVFARPEIFHGKLQRSDALIDFVRLAKQLVSFFGRHEPPLEPPEERKSKPSSVWRRVLLTKGCETCRIREATVMEPLTYTAWNTSISRRFIFAGSWSASPNLKPLYVRAISPRSGIGRQSVDITGKRSH